MEIFSSAFLRKLQRLKIASHKSFLGNRQGTHLSKRRGQGLEFSDFRPYTAGDDFRHIDWGVYGRTDRLYIRQFRAEEDLNVLVLLDTSSSMNFPAEQNKYEFAKRIALSLGFIAIANGDPVTFSLMGQRNTAKFQAMSSFSQAIKELMSSRTIKNFDYIQAIYAAIADQKIPGKCFLISDFLFDTDLQFKMLDILRAKNYEITVIQVLAPIELSLENINSQYLVDSETGESLEIDFNSTIKGQYQKLLTQHQGELVDYCKEARISYIQLNTEEDFNTVVLRDFIKYGILK